MFDVIVIGAGPVGSTVSKILAEKGYHILLAERLKMPHYKSCYGQLIKKSLDLELKVDKWLMPHIQPGCLIDYGAGRVIHNV